MKALALAAILILVCFPLALACGPDQFEVSGLHARAEGGYLIITGQVKNNCREPAAVWLKATTYGKDGVVLDTEEFMPSSTRNMAADSAYPFKTMLHFDQGIEKYSVVPVGVQKW
ncbi:MAG: hypothetical protein ABSC04_01645 [Syntrophobacteraceae bacterium]|jgi:hypothetical protein